MPSLNRNSLLHTTYHLGADVVRDMVYVTHPLVHAIEQPISNVYTEAKTVVSGAWNISHSMIHLSAYWFLGWMTWSWIGDLFPSEKRAIESTVLRAMKRARFD